MSVPLFGCAAVLVIKPLNIIFTKIGTRLHLDHIQRSSAGVFKAMFSANRDKCGFIFDKQEGFIISCYASSTFNDDPMLRTMVMQLQTEASTRFDSNAFNLKTVPFIDTVVFAPRPCCVSMFGGLWQILLL